MSINIYKININNILNKVYAKDITLICGGITINNLETQHEELVNEASTEYNNHWKMIKLTSIKIMNEINDSIIVQEIEEFLINKLHSKYGNQCINKKNVNKNIIYNVGDEINIYISYFIKLLI
jgi:hypothetical protein